MNRVALVSLLLLLAVSFVLGCSTGSNITQPGASPDLSQAQHSGPLCLGAWQVVFDKTTGGINAVSLREADYALNVISFLEPPAMGNLSIDFETLIFNDPILEVDVILTHPIPDPTFTGFDVRGIVFGPEVINADGRTMYMSPENFSDVPFGYQDGLLGAPHSYANYEGYYHDYKYFCDGLGLNEDLSEYFSNETNLAQRGHFSNGSTNRRHYVLGWEDQSTPINYLVFNYAIFASYDWPVGNPPYDLDDFPISTANAMDPFCFSTTIIENTLYYTGGEGGGELSLDVEVWDWQGFYWYEVVFLGPWDVFYPGIMASGYSPGSTSKSRIYHFTDLEGTPQSTDDIEIRIHAGELMNNIGMSWFLGLLPMDHPMYNMGVSSQWRLTVPVSDQPPVSHSAVLDEGFSIDEATPEHAPSIIANPSEDVYIGYVRNNSFSVPRPSYAYSTNSGADWNVMTSYITYTGGYQHTLSAAAIDANGDVYYKVEQHTSPFKNSNIVKCVMTGEQTSGMNLSSSAYGSALIFTYDGYPVGFGDEPNQIIYKKGTMQNSPYSNGSWTGWASTAEYTAVPAPARLSRIRNIVREPSNAITFVYFSSNNTDTWIRLARNADGNALSWAYGNDIYDGASDGYDRARDASIYLDSSGFWHSAFILSSSTPSPTEYIAYTHSNDRINWSDPDIAYEISGDGIINCPTVDVVDVSGNEVVFMTFWENGSIKLVHSSDGGSSWKTPVELGSGDDFFPDTVTTSDGYIHTCWMHDETGDTRIEYIRAHFIEE